MNYHKIKYRRIITPGPETGQITVSFERLALVHLVRITPQEAALLNQGRLENSGNIIFEYLIPEGGEDPAPFTITDAKSGPTSPIDYKGRLLSEDSGSRRGPVIGGGYDHGPRGRSGLS